MIMNNDLDFPKAPQQEATAAIGDSDAEKSEFFRSMGHELRNPLASIIAHVETLVEGVYGPLDSVQKNALAAIETSARQMLYLTSDVIDLHRIDAGVSPSTPTACLVSEKCESSMERVADLARSRSIQIVSEIHPQNLRVMADARRLQQILSELLSGAVLAMPLGGQVRLYIAADDHGLHIQTHSSTSKPASTTPPPSADEKNAMHSPLLNRLRKVKPIGMALLQKLVQLQEGTFTVREAAEHAVSMFIRLPLGVLPVVEPSQKLPPAVHSPENETTPSTAKQTPTILIADDQPTLVAVTRSYLESLGFQVITARDGHEAVQQTFSLQPDLILMDVRMPIVDGLHAIRQIRESPDPKVRDIAIISLSGHAGDFDKEKCMAAGASAYLSKPFGVKELDRVIADFILPQKT